MERLTENELLAELVRELTVPPIEPDEVTCKMIQDGTGLSDNKAMSFLKDKVAAGELTTRNVRLPNGRVVMAFRKA